MRVGIFLEVATTSGAIVGASVATRLPGAAIEVVFGVVLLVSVYLTLSLREPADQVALEPSGAGLARRLRLAGSYPTPAGEVAYAPRRVPLGFGIMAGAGVLSGLLGIGSGAVKVLALDQAMRLPFKVSTTTSNFMIGVTAAASAGVYLRRGFISPGLAMPVMLGVLAGSLIGARLLIGARVAPAAPGLRPGHSRPRRRDDRDGAAPVSRAARAGTLERPRGRARHERRAASWRRPGRRAGAAGGVAYLISDGTTRRTTARSPAPQVVTHDAGGDRTRRSGARSGGDHRPGAVVLVLTPVARVVFALLAFAEQRDRLYVVFSLIVLGVLSFGLTGHVL